MSDNNINLHLFRLSVLPFWQAHPYQPYMQWLENNFSLEYYCDNADNKLSFIPQLGSVKPLNNGRVFARKIWRYVTDKCSDNVINQQVRHILPLRIVPAYQLIFKEEYVKARKFFVYLTPHIISTQLMLSVKNRNIPRTISQSRDLKCWIKHGKFERSLNLNHLLRFIEHQTISGIIKPQFIRDVYHPSNLTFYISLDLKGRVLEKEELLKTKYISNKAISLVSTNNPNDQKIIDRFCSIITSEKEEYYSYKLEKYVQRRTSCHFNNWHDLLFLYYSTFFSLWKARQHIDQGGKISDTTYRRIMLSYDVLERLRALTAWQEEIDAIETLLGSNMQMRILREDLIPKGGTYMSFDFSKATIGNQQIGNNNRLTVLQQQLGAIADTNPEHRELIEALGNLAEVVEQSELPSYVKDDVSQKSAMLAEEANRKDSEPDQGKVKYFFNSIKTVVEGIAVAVPIIKKIGSLLGIAF